MKYALKLIMHVSFSVKSPSSRRRQKSTTPEPLITGKIQPKTYIFSILKKQAML